MLKWGHVSGDHTYEAEPQPHHPRGPALERPRTTRPLRQQILTLAGLDLRPSLGVFLRQTTELPPEAIAEAKTYIEELTARYGITGHGPKPGEDEAA